MKKMTLMVIVAIAASYSFANAQVGINTSTPQASLDVTGKPTIASSLDGIIPPRLTGDQLRAKTYTAAQTGASVYVTVGDSAPAGQTVNVKNPGTYYFDGSVWKLTPGIDTNLMNGTGTVIMINGVIQVAQEISARMTNDWVVPITNPSSLAQVGNIGNKLIDNYNVFTGTASGNTFTVKNSGTYMIGMNFPIQNQNDNVLNGNFYYGLYNNTDNTWVAFSIYTIDGMKNGDVKDISYQAAMDLSPSKTYSFCVRQTQNGLTASNAALLKIRGLASTSVGTAEIGFFSVKRLK
ncbi:hypothetical protein [Chryseobacterium sp. MMS23-Vi53]|uniref:hypothetical protein n=1 Tax=Chryseobacterium sp. MMS23-Vi53 TaxID=3386644 RepID=UPI0039EBC842